MERFGMAKYKRSPINYMGGKYRSLKHIIPHFPSNINTFYDLFAGSGTVHLNTRANRVIVNDTHHIVISLQEFISNNNPNEIYNKLNDLADKYSLYSEDSEGYIELRKIYNSDKDPIKLLALSQHSFNYLIRFNQQGDFNASHGKGISKLSQDFLEKLINFKSKSEESNNKYLTLDFREVLNLHSLHSDDLIYCDPPYLLSEAVYNEKRAFGGWCEQDTLDLFKLLDEINDKGSKFALTEMLSSKGRLNEQLIDWVERNKYIVRYNDVKYLGVPSTRNSDKKSVEVLVTNY